MFNILDMDDNFLLDPFQVSVAAVAGIVVMRLPVSHGHHERWTIDAVHWKLLQSESEVIQRDVLDLVLVSVWVLVQCILYTMCHVQSLHLLLILY